MGRFGSDLGEFVAVRLAHRRVAGQRAVGALGVLAVGGGDRLARHPGFQRPAVWQFGQAGQPAAPPAAVVHVAQAQHRIVDVAAALVAVGHPAHRCAAAGQRGVEHAVERLGRLAVLGDHGFRRHLAGGPLRIRLGGDDPHDTADGAGAVERALRAAQHLHAIDVHQPQVRIGGVVGDRDVVEVEADSRLGLAGERPVRQAANEDLVAAGAQVGDRDRDHLGSDLVKGLAAQRLDVVGRQRTDRRGAAGQPFGALFGRHHQLVEPGRLDRGLGRLARGGRGRRRGAAHDAEAVGVEALEPATARQQRGQGLLRRHGPGHGA